MYQSLSLDNVSGQRRGAMQTEEADHLAELSDGAGCTEIWEHLSERREADEAAAEDSVDEATPDSRDATAHQD